MTRVRIERRNREGKVISILEKEWDYFHIALLMRSKWLAEELALAIMSRDRVTIENTTDEP